MRLLSLQILSIINSLEGAASVGVQQSPADCLSLLCGGSLLPAVVREVLPLLVRHQPGQGELVTVVRLHLHQRKSFPQNRNLQV